MASSSRCGFCALICNFSTSTVRQYVTLPDISVLSYCANLVRDHCAVSLNAGDDASRPERIGRYRRPTSGPIRSSTQRRGPTPKRATPRDGWPPSDARSTSEPGSGRRSDGISLRAYSDEWIEQRNLRPRTQQHYESMLRRLDPARPWRHQNRRADADQDPRVAHRLVPTTRPAMPTAMRCCTRSARPPCKTK